MPDRGERPPGPSGHPLVGNTLQFVRGQGDFLEGVRADYGPVVSLNVVGVGDIVLVGSPDLVDSVLRSDSYRKASVAREMLSDLLGEGLLLAEGDSWQTQRRLVQPAFSRDNVLSYADVMTSRAVEYRDTLEEGDVYDVGDLMRRVTFQILLDALFGTDIDYEQWNLRESFQHILEPGRPLKQPVAYAVPKWVPLPMWRRYNKAIAHFEAVIAELVAEARARADERADLLSALVTATEDDEQLTDKQLRDEVMTLLFAGHETTATALTFTLHLVGEHDHVERKLVEELDSVLDGSPPTMADLSELSYTERVIRESMRLFPPVPGVAREPTSSVMLDGYHIDAGTTVAPSQWVIHRDPDLYDDPLTFDPDRWQRTPVEDRHRFAYFPFGGGPRRCIGDDFAMIESQILLATFLQSHTFEPATDEPLDPSVSIVTKPTQTIEATVRARSR